MANVNIPNKVDRESRADEPKTSLMQTVRSNIYARVLGAGIALGSLSITACGPGNTTTPDAGDVNAGDGDVNAGDGDVDAGDSDVDAGDVDVIKPSVPTINGGPAIETENSQYLLEGAADSNTASVEVSLDNGANWLMADFNDGAGTWSYMLDLTNVGDSYTVIVRAISNDGTPSDESSEVNVERVDNTAPAAPVIDQTQITVGPTETSANITGAITSPQDTARLEVHEIGQVWQDVDTYAAGDSAFSFDVAVPVDCELRAIDSSGNISVIAPFRVDVDSTAPDAPVMDMTPVTLNMGDTSFSKDVTVTSDTTAINVYYNSVQVHTEPNPSALTNLNVQVFLPAYVADDPGTTGVDEELRSDGTYTFTTVDKFGNESAGVDVTVEYAAPTITLPALDCAVTQGWCDVVQTYQGTFTYTGPVINVTGTCTVTGGSTPGTISNITLNGDGTGTFTYDPAPSGGSQMETIQLNITGPGGSEFQEQTHQLW